VSKLDRFGTGSKPLKLDDDGLPKTMKFKRETQFAPVPLEWAAKVAKRTRSPAFAVKVALAYMAWKAGGPTFPLTNTLLDRLGVNRENKRRALANLEKNGIIQLERRGRRAPIVTVLELK
jgi:hypothetical protein